MNFFLAVLGLCCCVGFSLAVASGAWSPVAVRGLLLCGFLLQSIGCRAGGPQKLRLPGSRTQAQQLWGMGLVALWHVGSSRIRD